MKIVISILVLVVTVYTQTIPESPNKYNSKGEKEGQWTILCDERFKYVEEISEAQYYRIINYEKGKPTGVVRDYYISGKKQWEGYLISDNPDVLNGQGIYFEENGDTSSIQNYKESIADGLFVYYLKGKKCFEGYIKENVREGDWVLMVNNYPPKIVKYLEGNEVYDADALEMFRRLYNNQDNQELAQIINNMALSLNNQGKYSEAEPLFKEALEKYKKIYKGVDNPDLAACFNNMALVLFNQGRYEEAEPLFDISMQMAKRIYGNRINPNLALILNNKGRLYSVQGKYAEAEDLFKEALSIYKKYYKNQDSPELVIAINNLSYVLNSQAKYLKAEPLFNELDDMCNRLYRNQNHQYLAMSLVNIATYQSNIGKIQIAENQMRKALTIYRLIYKNKDNLDIANTLNSLGLILYSKGDFVEAESLYIESLSIFHRLYSDQTILYDLGCISNLALLYNTQARYKEAEDLYENILKRLELVNKESDHPDLLKILAGYALLLYNQGRFNEAENINNKAFSIGMHIYKNRDHPDIALINNNMGLIFFALGKIRESEKYFSESLEMYRHIYKNRDHPYLATCINNYAEFLRNTEKYIGLDPEEFYNEALEMNRRLYKNQDHPSLALIINNYAFFLQEKNKYKKAQALFEESLNMGRRMYKDQAHPFLAINIINVALLNNKIGKLKEGEQYLNEAVEMYKNIYKSINHPHLARAIYYKAFNLFEQGEVSKSIPMFIESLDIYKGLLLNNFPFLSEKEKEAFLKTVGYIFSMFNSVCIRNFHNKEIINAMYSNLLLLKGIIGISTAQLREKMQNEKNDELRLMCINWVQKREYLAQLYNLTSDELKKRKIDLIKIEKETNELEKELNKKNEYLFDSRKEMDVTWADIQSKLKINDAAIELVRFTLYDKWRWTDTAYYAALILTKETKEKPEIVLLENGNELEASLFQEYKDYIEISQYRGKGEEISNDGKLYDAFWGKIAEKIKGKTRVYLSGDCVYNQINLNSLYNPKTKKYVIDETEIVLLTSTRELAMEKKEKKNNNTAELFGFPNYNLGAEQQKEIAKDYDLKRKRLLEGASLTELPGTKIEIEESGKILEKNKWSVNEYLSNDALEENLKKVNSPRLLHIATHGVFLEEEQINREKEYSFGMVGDLQRVYYDNPLLRSALFLSGANRSRRGINVEGIEDGVFTGYEAQNLNLSNTELVILSACETGLGVVKSGEGVYGLQRAFRVAGAKNIIMSLWKVSDEATKDLILSFYAKWTGGRSVKEAFREAQRELREKYPGAYYWAAFVLIGD